ncbi:MAG: phosphatase PAP2 family protein [Bacteroidales bacterium]|nr:phosphatase PAP2 family protein [Bacteroidales bacterium]
MKRITEEIKKLLLIDQPIYKGLLGIEWMMVAYMIFTLVLIGIFHADMQELPLMLLGRGGIVLGTVVLYFLYRKFPYHGLLLLRFVFQFGLLAYWYPDTYQFNRLFSNMDHVFAGLDQSLFGCQPAIEFSKVLPSAFWSEAFNMGYYLYYWMIAVVFGFYFFCRSFKEFQRVGVMIIASFFLYYIVYIFLPVAGPQFYYPAIGYPETDIYQIAQQGFPEMGHYFNSHTELLPAPGYQDGLFYKLVAMAQSTGERPTAAFPSSHIGVSVILMLLALKGSRTLALCMLPFFLLLCGATVYIQAHYLVDAIAGFLTAFVAYFLVSQLAKKF